MRSELILNFLHAYSIEFDLEFDGRPMRGWYVLFVKVELECFHCEPAMEWHFYWFVFLSNKTSSLENIFWTK